MSELTGRHVFAITTGAFAVIIAVNVVMAWKAVSTFPGLEVDNSYVASQEFDARRAAQEALGWTLDVGYAHGRARVGFTDAQGHPVQVADLSVLIGRTTEAGEDVTPDFTFLGDAYEAEVPLNPGYWMVRVTAHAMDGTLFQQRIDIAVRN